MGCGVRKRGQGSGSVGEESGRHRRGCDGQKGICGAVGLVEETQRMQLIPAPSTLILCAVFTLTTTHAHLYIYPIG